MYRNDKVAYSAEELLQDDDFIMSQLQPSRESNISWDKKVKQGAVDKDDYLFARNLVCSTHIASEFISDKDVFDIWAGIETSNKARIKKKSAWLYVVSSVSAAVAMLALVLLLANTFKDNTDSFPPLITAEASLDPEADIQLILNEEKSLSFGGNSATVSYNEEAITINGNDIVRKKELTGESRKFHQLIVPKGKRSMLTLSEGSRVWVNAGSRVAFPVEFDKKQREIYVDGEVYLEVTPNKDRPFIVKTTEVDVEVLGTSFDVMAYENGRSQRIVLVEGSVKVRGVDNSRRETILSPNDMYSLSNGIAKVRQVNVGEYVSWKDGLLYFRSEPLETITERLSDYYGRPIVCHPEVSQMKFSGKLDLKENPEKMLEGISRIAPIIYRYYQGTYTLTKR
jgi:hypothetical protein